MSVIYDEGKIKKEIAYMQQLEHFHVHPERGYERCLVQLKFCNRAIATPTQEEIAQRHIHDFLTPTPQKSYECFNKECVPVRGYVTVWK